MRVMSACVYIVQCAQSRQVFTLFTLSLIKIERKVVPMYLMELDTVVP